ncbi:MAG: replication initiation protein RepC, partial [Mesorhizobium sp.]
AQHNAWEIPQGRAADKWQVYRNLCEGKSIVGIGDRALAVLNALLSFYPDSELSGENGLIVFPSNAQLSLRAHGMADATLRRHLAALVDCGLITRRDSPNGKRYARKDRGGDIEEAFGFSLAPLLARAFEFEQAAERVRADNRALRLMRERITLHRR